MDKSRLFDLVRREDVVLWIGAGFSKYAEYPMGGELAQIIYSNFTDEEKTYTESNKSLQDISNDFVNIRNGSRIQLIEILRQSFVYKKPANTKYHDILAQIPHIKTIITTNYDSLIEDSFNTNGLKIVADYDVPLVRDNLTSIIKIHGDFAHSDKFIITKDDYTKFYNADLNTPIWHLVKERISTKTIVFIGYGFEDSNITAIFDKIANVLGMNKKEMFFIAPNVNSIKQKELIRRSINYINQTGEEFIEKLKENIDQNILFDVESGKTSVDIANKYIAQRNLYMGLKPLDIGYSIENINPLNGIINHDFKFTLKDRNFANKILSPSFTENLVIPLELITNVEYKINGLRHPLSDIARLKEITLVPVPQETTINFYFEDTDFTDIPLKFYRTRGQVKLLAKLKAGDIVLLIAPHIETNSFDISITSKHKDNGFIRPNDEIFFHELTLKLFFDQHLKLVTGNDFKFSFDIPKHNLTMENEFQNLEYFKKLKKIEKYYSIIFEKIERITDADRENVNLLINNINGNIIDNTNDKLIMLDIYELPDSIDVEYEFLNEDVFDMRAKDLVSCTLHGHKIDVGYLHTYIENPKYLNKEAFITKKESKIIIECKAYTYVIKYKN